MGFGWAIGRPGMKMAAWFPSLDKEGVAQTCSLGLRLLVRGRWDSRRPWKAGLRYPLNEEGSCFHSSGGMTVFLLWLVLLLPRLACGAPGPIQYLLDLRDSASHRLGVVMTIPEAGPSTELQFPAWNNLYQIRDFARNIEGLSAQCDGTQEHLARLDLYTWRAEARPCAKLSLQYAVYVSGSPPFSSSFDSEHAFLNFASLLFYLPEDRERAVRVKLLLPAGWEVATLLAGDGDGFAAPNYDALVDSPTEAGHFQDYHYTQGSAAYRVVVHADPKDYAADRLLASLAKITASETALMRDVPFSLYTFIFHFPREEGGGGGMEHRNGAAITLAASELREHWEHFEDVAAHEFFHLWNVKRIRPQRLEPIDYVHGNDTRDLWFSEGVTNTYAELVLLRAGLISRKTFYSRLAAAMETLEARPARFFESAEESGLEAWFEKYYDYSRPQRSVSYYNKGELLGFLLDLALRHSTANRAGLDDAMRRLNEAFARSGRCFREDDLRRVLAQLAPAFSGLEAFFRDYVQGTRELDYGTYLDYAGLKLESERRPGANPEVAYRVKEIGSPSPEQLRVREGWLRGEAAPAAAVQP